MHKVIFLYDLYVCGRKHPFTHPEFLPAPNGNLRPHRGIRWNLLPLVHLSLDPPPGRRSDGSYRSDGESLSSTCPVSLVVSGSPSQTLMGAGEGWGISFKCRPWSCMSFLGPEILHFSKLSGGADAGDLWTILWGLQGMRSAGYEKDSVLQAFDL